MPKYTFHCGSCGSEIQLYKDKDTYSIPCECCHDKMWRLMPVIKGQEVRETIDKYTNTVWKQDQEKILSDRRNEHYWKNIVPKLVETYSLETCLENGWVWIDDKGQMHIHDKPPGKR